MAETIAERVKHLREAKGWSQRMLGARSGTSGAYISRLEAGLLQPGVGQLQKLAAALHTTIEELVADVVGIEPDSLPQPFTHPTIQAIQGELERIAVLDVEELELIVRALRDRRAKMERDRKQS